MWFFSGIRRSSAALWVVFFVNGAVLATWAPRIPEVKSELHLSDGQIGYALLGVAVGSVPALTGTARLLRTVSARSVCTITSIAFGGALPLIACAPNGWALGGALAVLGAVSGCLDIAMNTAAIDYQDRIGASILSRLHGGYSLGVLAGAASGALASVLEVTVLEHFVAVSACLLVLAVAASCSLPMPETQRAPDDSVARISSIDLSRSRFGRALAIPATIAVMAVAALLMEGMITDWSALLVSRDFGGGAAVGAVAVVVFSTAMFLSRSFGDLIVDRLGAAVTLRCAAAVVSAAILLGLLLQQEAWGAVAVMGCAGIALGPLFPLLITEASHRSSAGAAVSTARVSAIGYGAYLGGPPLVGFLSEHIGLVGAFVLIACMCSTAVVAASMSLRGGPAHRETALSERRAPS